MTDTTVRIAWLGLLDSDDATGGTCALDHLAMLAHHVATASGFSFSTELSSCGPAPGRRALSAGVERVTLPLAGVAKTVWDRTSWELPRVIANADLIHLHDGFSRCCELALLLAKQLRKPVCITHWGIDGHWLSSELSLIELADVVVCHDRAAAESLSTSRPVEIVPCDVAIDEIGVPAPWPANHCLPFRHKDEPSVQYASAGQRLCDIYHRLIANTRRAAA